MSKGKSHFPSTFNLKLFLFQQSFIPLYVSDLKSIIVECQSEKWINKKDNTKGIKQKWYRLQSWK